MRNPFLQDTFRLHNNLLIMDLEADNLAFKPLTSLSKLKTHERNSLSLDLQWSNSLAIVEPILLSESYQSFNFMFSFSFLRLPCFNCWLALSNLFLCCIIASKKQRGKAYRSEPYLDQ